jgi:hypothetical protein
VIFFVPLFQADALLLDDPLICFIHPAEPGTCLIDGAEVIREKVTTYVSTLICHCFDLRDVATSGKSATRTTPLAVEL